MANSEKRQRVLGAEDVVERSNRYAKQFLILVVVVPALSLLIYRTEQLKSLRVPLTYSLPAFLIYLIVLLVILAHHGQSTLPPAPLIAGMLFMVGGGALDVVATIINTPTLEEEAHPVIRALLDSGHSLGFTYAYGLVGQVFLLTVGCMMWAAFLRHRQTVIASAWNAQPKSAAEFIKAALGGGHLTWRQFFLAAKLSEFTKAYHTACVVWSAGVGMHLNRWYLGLLWLRLVPYAGNIPMVAGVLLALTVYIAWLWIGYSEGVGSETAPN